jgi:hypothetical protein
MMIGVKYIQAVKTTGYISPISGKVVTKDESNKPIPKAKQARINIMRGSEINEKQKGTFVTIIINASGTKEKSKLMVPEQTDAITKAPFGR